MDSGFQSMTTNLQSLLIHTYKQNSISILITHLLNESESFPEALGLGSKIVAGSVDVPPPAVGNILAFSAFGRTDIESNIGFIIAPSGLKKKNTEHNMLF